MISTSRRDSVGGGVVAGMLSPQAKSNVYPTLSGDVHGQRHSFCKILQTFGFLAER